MESAQPSGVRTELHDGFSDHLEPTVPLDLGTGPEHHRSRPGHEPDRVRRAQRWGSR